MDNLAKRENNNGGIISHKRLRQKVTHKYTIGDFRLADNTVKPINIALDKKLDDLQLIIEFTTDNGWFRQLIWAVNFGKPNQKIGTLLKNSENEVIYEKIPEDFPYEGGNSFSWT